MGTRLSKDEIAAMRAAAHHVPHFAIQPRTRTQALGGAGGAAIEAGLFWADPREPELKVSYENR